ncbi:MAG: sensor histidine kinase, partial [Eubacteriales bacterium]|nr:sensor histidine kinase [Eubacteriales bacterium]
GRLVTVPGGQYAELAPDLEIGGASWLGVRALMKLNHFEPVGVVLCSVDLSRVRGAFELARIYEEQELCVLDPGGEALIGQPMEGAAPAAAADIQFIRMNDARGAAIWQTFTDADGFGIQIRTPQRCLLATVWERLTGLLIALAVLVVGALLFTSMLVLSIRDPIAKLVRVCERIREGDFSPIQDDDARDEMHTLISAFNLMAAHIEQLITEVYQKNLLQAQTEMRLLRSQINPHFVYNTLETIRASALECGNDDLAEMASLLGRTLRYGVSAQSEPVSVAREVMNLEDYLHLMQIHLNGRLQYTVTLEPGVSRCRMIKLVLQPLVENAINHGLSVTEGEGRLWIMGYFEGDDLCFVVSDNGVGIEPEKLKELTEYIEGRNDAYQSIGLRNTHRRIQLYYGERYGLTVRSVPGRGTSIEVRLPRVEEKEALA